MLWTLGEDSMEELPKSVGDEKVSGESDRNAGMVLDAKASDAEPFRELVNSELATALAETNDVIRRFNRDTKRLAALVVGAVVSAALLMLAVLALDCHPKAVALTDEAVPAVGEPLLNANSASLTKAEGLKGKETTGVTSGQESSVDHPSTEISPKENPSSQEVTIPSTPTSVLAFTPEISHLSALVTANSRDSARVIRPKIHNAGNRSSVGRRTIDVKRRLLALWHQSLARIEKSRTWTAYSNLSKGVKKKAAYTAETNH
jgi:hypothetical protein